MLGPPPDRYTPKHQHTQRSSHQRPLACDELCLSSLPSHNPSPYHELPSFTLTQAYPKVASPHTQVRKHAGAWRIERHPSCRPGSFRRPRTGHPADGPRGAGQSALRRQHDAYSPTPLVAAVNLSALTQCNAHILHTRHMAWSGAWRHGPCRRPRAPAPAPAPWGRRGASRWASRSPATALLRETRAITLYPRGKKYSVNSQDRVRMNPLGSRPAVLN